MDTKDIKLSGITRQELTGIVAEIIGELQERPAEWKVEIKKIENGLLVRYSGGDWDETKVYEQKEEGEEENYEHYVIMFYHIMDYFGDNQRPKYRKKYVNIEYVENVEE